MSETYLVAFSFSGAERDLVRAIAVAVRNILGDGNVFFDEWFEPQLAIQDADVLLRKIYRDRSVLVVPCISATWQTKPWTRGEHRAIRELEWREPQSTPFGDFYKVMPLRVGDGDIEEYPDTSAIAPDVRHKTIGQVARLIVERVRMKVPNAGRLVYLAAPSPEVQKQHDQVKAFLIARGWAVLPHSGTAANDPEAAVRDLRKCRAFIDLIEPGASPLHRPLVQAALDHTKKLFCYQQQAVVIDRAAAPDAAVKTLKVIHNSFDDFLNHLGEKLKLMAVDPMPVGEWPRVQVALRCKQPDRLLEQVHNWCREHNVEPDDLEGTDTVLTKYERTKCHGFLFLCDEAAMADGPCSTQKDMSECRQIVIAEQKRGVPPPVGLLYSQPPPPVWTKLRRGGPPNVHEILCDTPAELIPFFAHVRRVPN